MKSLGQMEVWEGRQSRDALVLEGGEKRVTIALNHSTVHYIAELLCAWSKARRDEAEVTCGLFTEAKP